MLLSKYSSWTGGQADLWSALNWVAVFIWNYPGIYVYDIMKTPVSTGWLRGLLYKVYFCKGSGQGFAYFHVKHSPPGVRTVFKCLIHTVKWWFCTIKCDFPLIPSNPDSSSFNPHLFCQPLLPFLSSSLPTLQTKVNIRAAKDLLVFLPSISWQLKCELQ